MNYHAERHALIEYLRVKLVANDWHAVSDAACDLRVLDAQWNAIPKDTAATEWAKVDTPLPKSKTTRADFFTDWMKPSY